jgi:iron complex outermembrane receptor protein
VLFGADADYGVADAILTIIRPTDWLTETAICMELTETAMVFFIWTILNRGQAEVFRLLKCWKNRINTRRIGVYAQDFISLTKNSKLLQDCVGLILKICQRSTQNLKRLQAV